MVSKYKPKNTQAQRYDQNDLKHATNKDETGQMTIYKASKHYGVPYVTLNYRIRGIRGKVKKDKRRPTCLDIQDEKKLAESLKILAKLGFGLSRLEVCNLVRNFVKSNKIATTFKHGYPGEDWFLGFKRNHQLSLKIPQNVEYSRKKPTDPFTIYEYFDLLVKTLDELDLNDKPARIWNLDETSLSIDPRRSKVVGEVNKQASPTIITPGTENTTVIVKCNATREKAPPPIIFKGSNIWDQWIAPESTGYPGTMYAVSKKGWMESNMFLNYFNKTIIPILLAQRETCTNKIVYDGHPTHVSLEIADAAVTENITILKLPAHTSHLLQLLHLSVFKSFKNDWDKKLMIWQRQNVGRKLPKHIFSQFLGKNWQSTESNVIKNEFRKAGIVLFDRDLIPKEAFHPEALERWTKRNEEKIANNIAKPVASDSNEDSAPINSVINPDAEIAGPSKSPQIIPPENGKSFEEFLPGQIKQRPQAEKQRRTRVCPGSKLLTSEDAIQRLKEKIVITSEQNSTKTTSIKTKVIVQMSESSVSEDLEEPEYLGSGESEPQMRLMFQSKRTKKLYYIAVTSFHG